MTPRRARQWAFLCAILLSVRAAGPAGAADQSAFQWTRAIPGAHQPGRIFRVQVPLDVYQRCNNFPHDIRIYDAGDVEWPFYLEPRPSHPMHESVPADQIHTAWIDEPQPHLRIDLAVGRNADGTRARHERIRVVTSGRGYIRRIEVHGSENQADWQILGEGYLVNAHHKRPIKANAIEYARSDYPHLQVRVYPDSRNPLTTFTARIIDLQRQIEPDMITHKLDHELIPVSAEDDPENARVYVLDLGHENPPVEMIRLRATGGDYVHTVLIHTRDDPDLPWRFSGAGSLYQIGTTVRDLIRIRRPGRYVRCEVYHDDGAPLSVSVMDVLVVHDHFIVEAKSSRQPVMYYGGPYHVSVPLNDLRVRTADRADAEWALHDLAPPVPNPDFHGTGHGRWGLILAAIAVGLAGIGVVAVIVMMFKHAATNPPGEGAGPTPRDQDL